MKANEMPRSRNHKKKSANKDDEIIEVTTPEYCPECLRGVGQEELDLFNGVCEECRGWDDE